MREKKINGIMDESSITTKPTTCPCGDIVSGRVVNLPLLFHHSQLARWANCGKNYEFCYGISFILDGYF